MTENIHEQINRCKWTNMDKGNRALRQVNFAWDGQGRHWWEHSCEQALEGEVSVSHVTIWENSAKQTEQ